MDRIVKKVLDKINDANFDAYIVGGYVRDYLLGIVSFDVDICTSALPKDIHKIFNINNANNYGGSNLKINKYNIDITTFRKENKYIKRHPNEVEYIDNLEIDLLRRDFTINAICMDKKGQIIDYLSGIEDLNNQMIRMIGSVDERIIEDPLRILRAIRFATVLDFEIEDSLLKSIKKNVELIKTLSKDRIKSELNKILMSKNFLKGLKLFDEVGISPIIELEYSDITYCNDILGMYSQIKTNLLFTKEEKNNIIGINEVLKNGIIDDMTLYKKGLYVCSVAAKIMNYKVASVNKMYDKLPIKDKKDIDITGDEIADLLSVKPSKVISIIIQDLEKAILEKRVKNKKDSIKRYIKDNKTRWLV